MYKNVKGTGHVKQRFIGKYIRGYGIYMKFKNTISITQNNIIVQKRLDTILFFEKHGIHATIDAFKVSKSTVYLWRQILIKSKYNEMSLIPNSTKPKTLRKMIVNPKILSFIKTLREQNYRLGKRKIKSLLDEYCLEQSIKPISVSLIGKIINRNNMYYEPRSRIYHNPNNIPKKKMIKDRLSSQYKTKDPGELLQIDSVVRFEFGIKRYIITAIDLKSRFTFAFAYKALSSKMALDFMKKLEIVVPFDINGIKTDNGLEFHGEFDDYLKQKGIKHYWSYPRTPKSNAYIERFNRTIQDEFVNANVEYIEDVMVFNKRLIDYLIYYNTVRPHQSLAYETPMGYLVSNCNFSNMSGAHTVDVRVVVPVL